MSSGSDSDEDFVPGQPEDLSEEGSADEETDLQFEKEVEQKAKKRKAAQETKNKKKRRGQKAAIEVEENAVEEEKVPELLNPEEDKKREDDLWAKFLEGTDTKPKPKETPALSSIIGPAKDNKETILKKTDTKTNDDEKAREKRIFEFAGETIVVENNVIKEKIKTGDGSAMAAISTSGPSRRGGGLSSILGQLNKTSTLSTLEKTKLDWNTFKKDEGIEEELQSHNKGKQGYLERKDFLERADMRQYEIERDLRMSRRSNR